MRSGSEDSVYPQRMIGADLASVQVPTVCQYLLYLMSPSVLHCVPRAFFTGRSLVPTVC